MSLPHPAIIRLALTGLPPHEGLRTWLAQASDETIADLAELLDSTTPCALADTEGVTRDACEIANRAVQVRTEHRARQFRAEKAQQLCKTVEPGDRLVLEDPRHGGGRGLGWRQFAVQCPALSRKRGHLRVARIRTDGSVCKTVQVLPATAFVRK